MYTLHVLTSSENCLCSCSDSHKMFENEFLNVFQIFHRLQYFSFILGLCAEVKVTESYLSK